MRRKTVYNLVMEEIHDFLAIEKLKEIANNPAGKCSCDIDKLQSVENKSSFPLCTFCQANALLAKVETLTYLQKIDGEENGVHNTKNT